MATKKQKQKKVLLSKKLKPSDNQTCFKQIECNLIHIRADTLPDIQQFHNNGYRNICRKCEKETIMLSVKSVILKFVYCVSGKLITLKIRLAEQESGTITVKKTQKKQQLHSMDGEKTIR